MKVTPGFARLARRLPILFLTIACLFAAAHTLQLRAAPKDPPIRYAMGVDVDYEKAFLNVTEVVQFTNPSNVALPSLVFHVAPLAFNAFTLSSATDGDTVLKTVEEGTILEVTLLQPLQPGASTSITLRWWGKLPVSNGRYGAAEGILLLCDWYPILSVLQDGVWERHQYTAIGDAFFEDVANYDVAVNVPDNVTIAASGAQVSRKGGQWVFHAQNARDFAMGMSSSYQTVSRKVDSATITVYYDGDRAEAAKTALDVAEEAMRWYNKHIGPYPFPTLAIVQGANGGEHTAQEHAGLFTFRADILTPATVPIYVAHELAHAWFFAMVGDDQIRQPWMDEGLVDSISLDFFKEFYPEQFPGVWGTWGGSWEDFKDTLPMNRGIMDFSNGSVYFFTIYRQGAAFFQEVREAMGDDAYWKALQTYYQQYSLKIAQPQDLLRTLRQAAPQADFVPIFRKYLDYPFLKYANMSVSIGGNEGQVWQGQQMVPITVMADSPTYTLDVRLDSTVVVSSTNRSVDIPVDTTTLSEGQHVITATASDGALNLIQVRRTFRVQKPTPTPTITPTPLPTKTPPPTKTPVPGTQPPSPVSPLPQPSPTQQPADAPGVSDSPAMIIRGLIVGVLVLAGVVVAVRRRR